MAINCRADSVSLGLVDMHKTLPGWTLNWDISDLFITRIRGGVEQAFNA